MEVQHDPLRFIGPGLGNDSQTMMLEEEDAADARVDFVEPCPQPSRRCLTDALFGPLP